uniref:Mcl1_mid domain-containing protein n=1 Tax=Rodentolepis nana TaxID=102285 RepID=A0A0R3TGU9_RODNA
LPVLVFVKTTIKEWTPSRGPIIVHCSHHTRTARSHLSAWELFVEAHMCGDGASVAFTSGDHLLASFTG